jgi:hypothetical protein
MNRCPLRPASGRDGLSAGAVVIGSTSMAHPDANASRPP